MATKENIQRFLDAVKRLDEPVTSSEDIRDLEFTFEIVASAIADLEVFTVRRPDATSLQKLLQRLQKRGLIEVQAVRAAEELAETIRICRYFGEDDDEKTDDAEDNRQVLYEALMSLPDKL